MWRDAPGDQRYKDPTGALLGYVSIYKQSLQPYLKYSPPPPINNGNVRIYRSRNAGFVIQKWGFDTTNLRTIKLKVLSNETCYM